MNMKDIIINSVKYSSSNWIKVVLLGLVIFIADLSNELSILGGIADEVRYTIIVIGFILGIYQIGFLFRIIEETTHGSNDMPKFDKLWDTFLHGIKEVLITVIYFIIPFILIITGVFLVDDLIGSKPQEIDFIIIISGVFLASLTYLIYQATMLNMADHHGTIKSAFDFKKIFKKARDIGFKRLGFIYLITVVFAATVEITVSDAVTVIPYDLGSIISSLLIAPFILIFIARILGSINQTLYKKR